MSLLWVFLINCSFCSHLLTVNLIIIIRKYNWKFNWGLYLLYIKFTYKMSAKSNLSACGHTVQYTSSHLNTEVKQCRAGLLLGLETLIEIQHNYVLCNVHMFYVMLQMISWVFCSRLGDYKSVILIHVHVAQIGMLYFLKGKATIKWCL